MTKIFKATETLNLEDSRKSLETSANWARLVLNRLQPQLPEGKLKILEVGSAQGRALIALSKLGHESYGIEPFAPAIHVANMLSIAENVEIDIREGCAEKIPFETASFDLVLAFAVMEHVEDIDRAIKEICRVLKPGGIFWFSSASGLCPIQYEIRGFPLFGWYPDKVKKRIMKWAVKKRPELVGYTKHPAMHWWTPGNTRTRLYKGGFIRIWDRWDLHSIDESIGLQKVLLLLAKKYLSLRFIGDLIIPGCSYAAKKNTNRNQ